MVIQAVVVVQVQKMCYYSHRGRHMHAAKCASGGALIRLLGTFR